MQANCRRPAIGISYTWLMSENKLDLDTVSTVGENIIATIKMRIYFCSPFSNRSSNFTIAKVVAFNLLASTFV